MCVCVCVCVERERERGGDVEVFELGGTSDAASKNRSTGRVVNLMDRNAEPQ